MRSISAVLQQKKIRLKPPNPRTLHTLYRLLRSLKLEGLVQVTEEGEEVPENILKSPWKKALLAYWLAKLVSDGQPLLGVDVGLSNIGVALVVGEVVAFTCLVKDTNAVVDLVKEVARYAKRLSVRIGFTKACEEESLHLLGRLQEMGINVELIHEREAGETIMVGDFTGLTKLSKHELDALKIALSPTESIKPSKPRGGPAGT